MNQNRVEVFLLTFFVVSDDGVSGKVRLSARPESESVPGPLDPTPVPVLDSAGQNHTLANSLVDIARLDQKAGFI